MDRIKKIWETEGKKKNLTPPRIFMAVDKNNEKYYVYEDYSTVVKMFLTKSNIAFAILKKYTKVKGDKYFIDNIFKLHPISCPTKTKKQRFVQEYLGN